MINRRILARGVHGQVVRWEPLGSAMCDALVRFDDGSECWYGSSELEPADGLGPLPSRRAAQEQEHARSLAQLQKIRADLVTEIRSHKRWPGMEFAKGHLGRMIDGAIADLKKKV